MGKKTAPSLGSFLYVGVGLALCVYFMFAAVQGDYGVFRRIEVDAQTAELKAQLEALQSDVDTLSNLTKRLSDDYLDLDLLDEQARNVLGLLRSDEIVIQ